MSPLQKGQKLTDNPKGTLVHFRADKDTIEKLEYTAEKLNISKSEVIRNVINDQYEKLDKRYEIPHRIKFRIS